MNRRLIFIILIVIFLLGTSSCNTANNDNLTIRTVFPLFSDNVSKDSLIVIQNISDNYMVVLTKHNDVVISICGGGNLDFCYTDNYSIIIDSAIFDEIGVSYILPLNVKGSTYGAVEYYIIHREHSDIHYWNVYKLPFSNLIIQDVDEDGLSEIITYEDSDSLIYSFKHGRLCNTPLVSDLQFDTR